MNTRNTRDTRNTEAIRKLAVFLVFLVFSYFFFFNSMTGGVHDDCFRRGKFANRPVLEFTEKCWTPIQG